MEKLISIKAASRKYKIEISVINALVVLAQIPKVKNGMYWYVDEEVLKRSFYFLKSFAYNYELLVTNEERFNDEKLVKRQREEIEKLSTEKENLLNYIDRLHTKIMLSYPDAFPKKPQGKINRLSNLPEGISSVLQTELKGHFNIELRTAFILQQNNIYTVEELLRFIKKQGLTALLAFHKMGNISFERLVTCLIEAGLIDEKGHSIYFKFIM